jgi:ABC-type transport system substrate-binding protein
MDKLARPPWALGFYLGMAWVLTGCARGPKTVTTNVLRYPLTEEPASLDPAVVVSADTNEMIYNVYEGLVRYDKDLKLVPWLANSWELSGDKRTYTFRLNPRAKFHRPFSRLVTASDVKWSIERILNPETKGGSLPAVLADIEGAQAVLEGKTKECSGVRVIDAQTVAITAVRPCSYLLQELGVPIFCREAVEKGKGRFTLECAIGTGPFMFKEYRPGSVVVLEANPEYYREKPKLARIERPIILDMSTSHIAHENGETHISRTSVADYVADLKDLKLKDQALLMDLAGTSFVEMHPGAMPVFRDKRVRRAIAEAIDRDRINKTAYLGTRITAGGFLPPGVLGYNPNIRTIPYDPAHARKLLAEAGYPGGKGFPPLAFEYVQTQAAVSASGIIIRENLKENLGLNVDLREREAGSFYSDLDKNRLGFFMVGSNALDPHDFLTLQMRTGGRYNTFGYSNPRFDAIVDRGDSEFDPQKRAAAFREADQMQLDDVVAFPINYNRVPYLVSRSVLDLDYNIGGLLPHFRTRMAQ